MSTVLRSPSDAPDDGRRSLWIAYGCACAVAWLLYVLAGAEFQRGLWQLWQAVYQATLGLWPPMLLGVAVFPWVQRMQDGRAGTAAQVLLHAAGALVFGVAWQAGDYAVSSLLYGRLFANAMGAMIAAAPGRDPDQPCPCGSGQRFARCHGAHG